jgi:CRISPR-associated protein Csm5
MNYAKKYKMTIQALSPIHIGTGDELSPFEYVITDNINGEPELHIIDLPGMISGLNQQQKLRFYDAVNKGADSVRYLRKFIRHNTDLTRFSLHTLPVCQNIWNIYQNKLDSQENQLIVNLFYRNTKEWQPVIPGSSIKGAIRTAIVSELARQTKALRKPAHPKSFEKEVLGCSDPRTDPFRCLKIADAMLPDAATFIDKTEILKLKKDAGPDPAGIQMFYEQCFSMLDEETIEARGTLELDDQLPMKTYFDKNEQQNKKAVSMNLSISQLVNACKAFYLPKMQEEHSTFYRSNLELEAHSQTLLAVTYQDNEFPIRLGRFSHVECTTVDQFRQPYNDKGWGKTRTLSGGTMPMGWAKVRLEEMR